jgi:hypothetical protein
MRPFGARGGGGVGWGLGSGVGWAGASGLGGGDELGSTDLIWGLCCAAAPGARARAPAPATMAVPCWSSCSPVTRCGRAGSGVSAQALRWQHRHGPPACSSTLHTTPKNPPEGAAPPTWNTGIFMRRWHSRSTKKHSGLLMSSRLMPPKVGSSAHTMSTSWGGGIGGWKVVEEGAAPPGGCRGSTKRSLASRAPPAQAPRPTPQAPPREPPQPPPPRAPSGGPARRPRCRRRRGLRTS